MRQFYKEISLINSCPDGFSRDDVLKPLSTINLFIGANNSGKSRLLRELFKSTYLSFTPNDFSYSDVKKFVLADVDMQLKKYIKSDSEKIGKFGRNYLADFLKASFFRLNDKNSLEYINNTLNNIIHAQISFTDVANGENLFEHVKKQAIKSLERLKQYKIEIGNEKKIYIPILRGLRALDTDQPNREWYAERTRSDYGFNSEESAIGDVFTGLSLRNRLQQLLLDSSADRKRVMEYEKFLSKTFFDGEDVEIHPRKDDKFVWIRIGKDDELPVFNLGDGIQQIIILTFLPFMNKERCLFFIEEPDFHLHPSLQRKLIDTFLNDPEFNHHQYFCTTHSNHLLDLTADFNGLSTFIFRKNQNKFTFQPVATDDSNILIEIGARASSVFLSNAVLWVEGYTDRLYIREFMKQHDGSNSIKEDKHFSFLVFGGSNIARWTFDSEVKNDDEFLNALKIRKDSYLVLDGDNAEKEGRVERFTNELEENLHVLKVKEIENLLPEDIVRKVARQIVEESRLEKKPESNCYEAIHESEYSKPNKGLGAYLDEVLDIDYFKKGESGTILQKGKFCQLALNALRQKPKWPLTEGAKALCENLNAFIKKVND